MIDAQRKIGLRTEEQSGDKNEMKQKKMDFTSNISLVAIVLMSVAFYDGHCKSHSNPMTNELLTVSIDTKDKNRSDDITKEPKFFDEFECK